MTKTIDIIIGGFDDGRTPSVQQYDTNSRCLLCRLWEKPGVPYTMSENAVVGAIFKWRKAEPAGEYKTEIIDRSTVLVTIPGDATQVSGVVFMQLVFHQDGGVMRGPEINFMVLESLAAGEEGIENPELLFGKLIEEANAATERANDAADALENISAMATTLPADREATAQIIDGENGKLIVIGVPKGEPGQPGEPGESVGEVTIDAVKGLREALEEKMPAGYINAWNDGGLSIAKAKKDGSMYPYIGATAEGKVFTLVEGDTFRNALMEDETAADASKLGGVDASDYVQESQVVNNFTTTEEGFVADARALKELSDRIGSAGSEVEDITTTVENASLYLRNTMGCKKLGRIVFVSGTVQVGSEAVSNKAFRSGLPYYAGGVNTFGVDDTGTVTAIYYLNGTMYIRNATANEIIYYSFMYFADA